MGVAAAVLVVSAVRSVEVSVICTANGHALVLDAVLAVAGLVLDVVLACTADRHGPVLDAVFGAAVFVVWGA